MTFKSKAQMKYMFSEHPRIAKRWAKKQKNLDKLPEKTAAPYFKIPKFQNVAKFMSIGKKNVSKPNFVDGFVNNWLRSGSKMSINPARANKIWPTT